MDTGLDFSWVDGGGGGFFDGGGSDFNISNGGDFTGNGFNVDSVSNWSFDDNLFTDVFKGLSAGLDNTSTFIQDMFSPSVGQSSMEQGMVGEQLDIESGGDFTANGADQMGGFSQTQAGMLDPSVGGANQSSGLMDFLKTDEAKSALGTAAMAAYRQYAANKAIKDRQKHEKELARIRNDKTFQGHFYAGRS